MLSGIMLGVWVAAVFGLHSYVTYLAWVSVVLWLLALRERVRMSVPVYQSRMGIPICVRLTPELILAATA